MRREKKRDITYLPLRISLGFLVITELLVWIGPIDYKIGNGFLLVFFLAVVNLSFYFGYKRGVKSFRPTSFRLSMDWINVFIVLGGILNLIYLFNTWASRGISLSLDSIVFAIINSGDIYFSDVKADVGSSSRIMQVLSIFRWSAVPFGMYYWKKLSKPIRIVLVFNVFFEVLTSLGKGTRQGLFDIIIVSMFCYYAGTRVYYDGKEGFEAVKKKIRYVALLFGGVFILFFIASNLSRSGLSLSSIQKATFGQDIRAFYGHLPQGIIYAISAPVSYLCQGYYALSLGLDMGVLSPTPFSSNLFGVIWAQTNLGTDPLSTSYMYRLESYGIDSYNNWHTIYLWLANQYTFYLVPVIIYIVGYCFGRLWCDILRGKNPIAIPLFALILVMVFYFYANNQVLSFSFLPFIGWLFIYLLTVIFSKRNS